MAYFSMVSDWFSTIQKSISEFPTPICTINRLQSQHSIRVAVEVVKLGCRFSINNWKDLKIIWNIVVSPGFVHPGCSMLPHKICYGNCSLVVKYHQLYSRQLPRATPPRADISVAAVVIALVVIGSVSSSSGCRPNMVPRPRLIYNRE